MKNRNEQKMWNEEKLTDVFANGEENSRSNKETIEYEPPYNMPHTDNIDDLRNFGYGGYGGSLNMDVSDIRDIRMLVNYYSFLTTDECQDTYERIKRDHKLTLFRATRVLLTAVHSSHLCEDIQVPIRNSKLVTSASQLARVLIDNSMEYGTCQINYDSIRLDINSLVAYLRYYFYAHIDHFEPEEIKQ